MFSLITPTYNSSKTLADTLESIIAQVRKYPELAGNLEHIIIDGVSTDGTLDIVKNYQNEHGGSHGDSNGQGGQINIKLISEPDKGIFDAMNKGVRMATGEIVGIINSDDFYYDADALFKVVQAFESDPEIDAVYGDLKYVDNENIKKQTRFWKAGLYEEENLNWGWSIPHPTFFIRRRIYEKLIAQNDRIFDTTFSITSCYELTFRLLKINKIKVKYIPETLVTMRDGGASGKNLIQRIKGWKEQRRVWVVNSLKIPPFFIIRRVLNKVSQFLRRQS